jgi:hypothetical protein
MGRKKQSSFETAIFFVGTQTLAKDLQQAITRALLIKDIKTIKTHGQACPSLGG